MVGEAGGKEVGLFFARCSQTDRQGQTDRRREKQAGRGSAGEKAGEGRKGVKAREVPSHHTLPHSMSTESRAPWNTAWSHHVPCGAHGVQVIQLQSSSSGRSAGWLDLK